MKIVSISLSEENLADLRGFQKELGLSGNSEAVRAALSLARAQLGDEKLGTHYAHAVLVLFHSHESEKFVSSVKHLFQGLVQSQNHACINGDECVDTFVLHGPGNRIRAMRDRLLSHKAMRSISLLPLVQASSAPKRTDKTR